MTGPWCVANNMIDRFGLLVTTGGAPIQVILSFPPTHLLISELEIQRGGGGAAQQQQRQREGGGS